MQKIWDCFSFFCEKELLQLRIKHLYPYVDYFVITEADMTHQARPKKFLLPELLTKELAWAKDKIKPIYLNIDLNNLPDTKYSNDEKLILGGTRNSVSWKIENLQRNASMQELQYADLEDIIMIGDLDEIPNKNFLSNIRHIAEAIELFAVGMINCPYYLNVRLNIDGNLSHWPGTVVGKRKHLIQPQMWREVRELVHWGISLGYHFSWLIKYIQNKVNNTAHEEIALLYDTTHLIKKAILLKDMYDRTNHSYVITDIENDENFPECFISAKKDFPELFAK